MQKIYIQYTLGMKTPTSEFKKMGFEPVKQDIIEAVDEFNKRYSENEKKLIFLGVDHRGCYLMLVAEPNVKISLNVKDLLIFCKYLYNVKSWNKYTREPNTLFYAKNVEQMTGYDAGIILCDDFGLDPTEYMDPEEMGNPYLEAGDIINTEEDGLEELVDTITDEQCISILQFIINMRNVGTEERRRQKEQDIRQIKAIISKWV